MCNVTNAHSVHVHDAGSQNARTAVSVLVFARLVVLQGNVIAKKKGRQWNPRMFVCPPPTASHPFKHASDATASEGLHFVIANRI
jgi:hypothetical protein